jgi:hypothetical protein
MNNSTVIHCTMFVEPRIHLYEIALDTANMRVLNVEICYLYFLKEQLLNLIGY